MGCGKTTIAKLISKVSSLKFLDLDEEIEKTLNLKISEIYKIFGQDYFRALEAKFFKNIAKKSRLIVSTGGGSFVENFDNFKIAKKTGVIIFLNAEFYICFKRIENSNRPLVLKNSVDGLKAIYFSRLKRYKKMADFCVYSGCEPFVVVLKILKILNTL